MKKNSKNNNQNNTKQMTKKKATAKTARMTGKRTRNDMFVMIADLLPAMILLIVLPILTKAEKVKVLVSDQIWYPGGDTGYDFFMFWKGRLLLILVVWMLFMLLDRMLIRRMKAEGWRTFFPLGIYGVLAILSTVFSVNKGLSTYGMLEQYETIWVILGYLVTAFYCYQIASDKQTVLVLLGAVCVGAALQALVGLSQLIGMDFWNGLGKWLITLGNDSHMREGLQFVFADSGVNPVYMGASNPNYAGVYIIMTIPIALGLGMVLQKTWQKVCCFVLAGLLLICLIGTGSKTGMFLLAALVFLSVVIMSRKKKIWAIPVCLVVILAGFAAYDAANAHVLIQKMSKAVHYVEEYKWQEVEPEANGVRIRYCGRDLFLQGIHEMSGQAQNSIAQNSIAQDSGALDNSVQDALLILEDHTTPLKTVWNEKMHYFYLEDPAFRDLAFDTFVKDGAEYLQLRFNNWTWTFMKPSKEEPYVYVNPAGKVDNIVNAKTALPGLEKSFSSRGYIWGRTVPLLTRSILWGTGPDTFSVVFPQNDYHMRANTSGRLMQELLTKPHSMYLQIALQTGILSLAAVVWFVVTGLRSMIKKMKTDAAEQTTNWLLYGVFISCVGYLLMGIMNDSVLATTPVFCAIWGIGMRYAQKEKL